MREILFRGKSVDDNEWVYGGLCIDAVEQLRGVDAGANAFIRFYDVETKKMKMVEVHRETVGQFTGLKDKNGKKIFEGDIVLMPAYSRGKHKTTVYFKDGKFAVDGSNYPFKDIKDFDLISLSKSIEVIGNIHDKEEQ